MRLIPILLLIITSITIAQNINEQKYRLAEGYYKAGDVESAEDILLEIHKNEPTNPKYFTLLIDVMRQQNKFSDMKDIVIELNKTNPNKNSLNLEAELHWRTGEVDNSNKIWEDLIKKNDKDPNIYSMIAQTQIELQLFEKAISTLKSGRDNLNTEDAFSDALSRLYIATGNYQKGIEEVINLLLDKKDISLAQGRTFALMTSDEAQNYIDSILEEELSKKPNNFYLLELYAWFLNNSARQEKALEIFIKLDKLKNTGGREIINFANTARNDGKYDVALKAYSYIIKQGKENRYTPSALYGFSRTLENKIALAEKFTPEEVNEVIESYENVLKDYPSTQNSAQAMNRIAVLYNEYLNNFEKAEEYLLNLKKNFRNMQVAAEGINYLGNMYLQVNEEDKSKDAFNFVINSFRNGRFDEVNEAKYNLALITYYKGELDTAKTLFKQLSTISDSDISNDALNKMILIEQNKDFPDLVKEYSRYELLEKQGKSDKAIEILEKIIQKNEEASILDLAELTLAEKLLITETNKGISILLDFISNKAESLYHDKSLFLLASYYMETGNKDSAINYFKKILSEYPNSIYLQDSRQNIRILRNDGI